MKAVQRMRARAGAVEVRSISGRRRIVPALLGALVLGGFAGATHAQLPGWSTQLPITITEGSGVALTNYQVRLTLDTATLISGGLMNADASDLRFGVDANGSTLLDYWIEGAVNTATTVVWVKVPLLPASTTSGIYLFTGNPAAPAVSALSIFDYVDNVSNSATNQVFGGAAGGIANSQRGFRFSPNEDILLIQLGKNEPTGSTRYVTLFDNATQAIVAQLQVPGPAAQYSYANIAQPIWLTQGTQYLLEMYQSDTDGYYYGSSAQINPKLTYYDMRYCNACTQNTFPTNFLNAIHYGYPDFEFMTRQHAGVEPVAAQTNGPTSTSLESSGTPVVGQSVTFTARVDGLFGPTGNVTFNEGATTLCANVPLDAGSPPSASCAAVLSGVGSHDITAIYSGDIDDATSTSDPFSQSVNPMVSTTLLGTNCQTTFVENQPFTMIAAVNGFSPTGSVTFSDGGGVLGSVPLLTGSAGFTVAGFSVTGGMPAQTHALTAGYGGDSQNTKSTSGTLLLTVLSANEAILRNGFDQAVPACPIE
jgi:hypothetical protein